MVAEEAKRRFPGFEYNFEPQAEVERLMNAWPGSIDDTAARQDWGWKPKYDFQQSVDQLLELLRNQ